MRAIDGNRPPDDLRSQVIEILKALRSPGPVVTGNAEDE
jgi:hypothetical protein